MPTPACWLSAQIKPLCQYLKRSRHDFLRFFAELTVEAGMIVRVHPTLKCLRSVGSVKEVRRDAQSTHLVASGPGGTDLVGLATHLFSLSPRTDHDLAWVDKKLEAW
jgi:hypothetical protein